MVWDAGARSAPEGSSRRFWGGGDGTWRARPPGTTEWCVRKDLVLKFILPIKEGMQMQPAGDGSHQNTLSFVDVDIDVVGLGRG